MTVFAELLERLGLTDNKKSIDIGKALDEKEASLRPMVYLNWRESVVDLMKLVGLDSDFQTRSKLAEELKYEGDPSDSAAMNTWLHTELLVQLTKNGGIVPKELLPPPPAKDEKK